MHKTLLGSVLALLAVASACTSAATPTTSVSSAPSARSTVAPSPSPTPSPTPTPRTKAEDAADVKAALVTAKDLGDPWVKPKSVSRVGGKKGELCPGHVSALKKVRFTADASTDLTRGKGPGTNIVSYSLQTLPDEDVTAVAQGIEADQKACGRYQDANGFNVERTVEGPASVSGGELVAGWVERIYYVKPRKLAYARHYLVAHQGRVVTTASYAFLTDKKDPKAKDFSEMSRLLEEQLTKNDGVFE